MTTLQRARRMLMSGLYQRFRPYVRADIDAEVGRGARSNTHLSRWEQTPAAIDIAAQIAQLNDRLGQLVANADQTATEIAALTDGLHTLRTDVQAANRRLEWVESDDQASATGPWS